MVIVTFIGNLFICSEFIRQDLSPLDILNVDKFIMIGVYILGPYYWGVGAKLYILMIMFPEYKVIFHCSLKVNDHTIFLFNKSPGRPSEFCSVIKTFI